MLEIQLLRVFQNNYLYLQQNVSYTKEIGLKDE